ncbi:MAG: WD40 repeat domain-containing protein [Gemmataceae bacterium]
MTPFSAKIAAAALVAGTLSAGIGLADDPAPKPPAPVAGRVDRFGDPLPDGAIARFGTVRWRADRDVAQVAFSHDGTRAVGGTTGGIVIWDAATGRPLDPPGGGAAPDWAGAVALSVDGKLLATGGGTRSPIGPARLWELATGRELPLEKQTAQFKSLTFSPAGTTLAGTAEPSSLVYLWELPSGRLIAKLDHRAGGNPQRRAQNVRWLDYSPDGKTLYTAADRQAEVRVWDAAAGKQLRSIPIPADERSGPRDDGLALAPDGKTLAAAGDRCIVLLDTAAGGETGRIPTDAIRHTALAYADGGKVLVARSPQALDFFDPVSGKRLASATDPELDAGVSTFAAGKLFAAPAGRRVALALPGRNGLRVWDAGGTELGEPTQFAKAVVTAAFADAGKELVAVVGVAVSQKGDAAFPDQGSQPAIRRWQVANRKEMPPPKLELPDRKTFFQRSAETLSPDGRFLVTADTEPGQRPRFAPVAKDGKANLAGRGSGFRYSVRVIDLATGKTVQTIDTPQALSRVLAWSADGKTLASTAADSGGVQLYDAATGTPGRTLAGESRLVTRIAFAQDGGTLAVAYHNPSALWLWDLATGSVAARLPVNRQDLPTGGPQMAFAPDGKTLAAGDAHGQMRRWDTATGTERSPFAGPKSGVTKCAYTPDGRLLIAGGTDGSVWAWDAATGRVVRQLTGHRHAVTSLTLTPDGKTLATGSADTTVLLWDVAGW